MGELLTNFILIAKLVCWPKDLSRPRDCVRRNMHPNFLIFLRVVKLVPNETNPAFAQRVGYHQRRSKTGLVAPSTNAIPPICSQ